MNYQQINSDRLERAIRNTIQQEGVVGRALRGSVCSLPLQHTSHAWVLEGCQNQVFILFCDDTCPDYPNQKHENHAHGERVEDQRVHDSDASFIGSVVRKQLVHLILAPLDAE